MATAVMTVQTSGEPNQSSQDGRALIKPTEAYIESVIYQDTVTHKNSN